MPRRCTCRDSTTRNLTYRYAGRDFRLTDVGGKVAPDIIGWLLAGNFGLDCGCNFDRLFLACSALKTGNLGLYVIVIRL